MKKYTSPEIEIKAFAVEDIITASSQGMDTNASTPVASVDGSGNMATEFDFSTDFK